MARGLFGRSSELATIVRALEAAASGQARAVALVGEPGTCEAPIAASLGLLAAALGDRACAEEHFAAALAMTRLADAPALSARCEALRKRALGAAPPAATAARPNTIALKPTPTPGSSRLRAADPCPRRRSAASSDRKLSNRPLSVTPGQRALHGWPRSGRGDLAGGVAVLRTRNSAPATTCSIRSPVQRNCSRPSSRSI